MKCVCETLCDKFHESKFDIWPLQMTLKLSTRILSCRSKNMYIKRIGQSWGLDMFFQWNVWFIAFLGHQLLRWPMAIFIHPLLFVLVVCHPLTIEHFLLLLDNYLANYFQMWYGCIFWLKKCKLLILWLLLHRGPRVRAKILNLTFFQKPFFSTSAHL